MKTQSEQYPKPYLVFEDWSNGAHKICGKEIPVIRLGGYDLILVSVGEPNAKEKAQEVLNQINSHETLAKALKRTLSFIEAKEFEFGLKSEAAEQARTALRTAKQAH